MDDQQPHGKPIPTETVWGDPQALDNAAAARARYPVCAKTGLHCRWNTDLGCTLSIACPVLEGGESALG